MTIYEFAKNLPVIIFFVVYLKFEMFLLNI